MMEQPERFSDYLFAKMGTTTGSVTDTADTNADQEAPKELTGFRKWLSENLLLMVTLSGVILGVVIGESIFYLNI